MSTTLNGITCSPVEWAYLAALKGASTLVGTIDPFTGWLASEVEEALHSARQSLLVRGFITAQPDGRLCASAAIDPLVKLAVAPACSAILTCHEAGREPLRRYFHIAGEAAVEQANGEQIELVGPLGLTQVVARIESLCNLDRFTSAPAPPATAGCRLSEAAWSTGQEAAQTGGAAAAQTALALAGLPEESARSLANAIAQPVATGSLLLVSAAQSDWEVLGQAYLVGEEALWLIGRAGQAVIEVTPAAGSELAQSLRRMLEQGLATA